MMNHVSDPVQHFFAAYEQSMAASDPAVVAAHYADSFMLASPQGTQAVKKEDFRKAMPQRAGFFARLGLAATTITSLEETKLDDHYRMVKVAWTMRFEKDPDHPVSTEIFATYILQPRTDRLEIVFQLDHQDLIQHVRELGLLPAGT